MTVTRLPPELQGKAIVDGPLPFLFGAKAETIKARYWIRVLPETGNGKFWLEAVPKSRQDVQNFKIDSHRSGRREVPAGIADSVCAQFRSADEPVENNAHFQRQSRPTRRRWPK